MKYTNNFFTCRCVQIDDMKCEYNSEIHIYENNVTKIIINDVKKEHANSLKDKNNVIIVFKKEERYITAVTDYAGKVLYRYFKENESDFETSITLEYISSKLLDGFKPKDMKEIAFRGFECEVTDGLELLGEYPYVIEQKRDDINDIELYIKGNDIVKSDIKGFSYIIRPLVSKIKDSIHIGMNYKIQFMSDEYITLEKTDELISNLVLFLEVLCGEVVVVTKISMFYSNEICDYIRYCNFRKDELHGLSNGGDTRSYLRKKIFKITDFGSGLKKAVIEFEKIVTDRILSYEAYRQILLDEEVGIFTYNNFLKIMQIIEGFQRTVIGDEEKEEFIIKKSKITEKLECEEDRKLIDKYTTYNGENFRKCLKEFTCRGVYIVSELSKTKICEKCKILIEKILNDRDVYTHASLTGKPILLESELEMINYCYLTFFRIVNLSEMGLSNDVIRNRLRFDRGFRSYYPIVFDIDIKNDENSDYTGEFDRLMWTYQ